MDTFLETTKNYFDKYYMEPLKTQYADFNGTATRAQYWYFVLFYAIIALVLNFIDGLFFQIPILTGLLTLALLVPMIALGVRRLHDLKLSGWLYLIILIPVLGFIALIILFCLPEIPTRKKAN